jgi:cystathionine gamma-synthase
MAHEAVIAGRPARAPGAPLNAPIVPASTYHQGGVPVYGRDGNPGWAAFEDALGALEHGSCVAFASGLAASNAILDELASGARLVAQRAPYFGVAEQLRERATRGQLELEALPELTPAALEAVVHGAGVVWVEGTTSNTPSARPARARWARGARSSTLRAGPAPPHCAPHVPDERSRTALTNGA